MQLRVAYATGPRWVRVVALLAAGGAAALVLAATTGTVVGTVLACLALGLAVVAAVAEPWDRRRLARAIGWHGDLADLVAVAAAVDAGRAPAATERQRELARRYAARRLADQRGGQTTLLAAAVAIMMIMAAVLVVLGNGSVIPLLPALVATLHLQYRVWVLLPRYRRSLRSLGGTEREWALRLG